MEYLSAHLNRSPIVTGDFFTRDLKNGVPRPMLRLNICRIASILQDSTWSTTCPNRFMKSMSDSFSYSLMFCRVLMFCLWWPKRKKWPKKAFEISWNMFMKFGGKRWNHERASPCRLDGKTLHNSASFLISRVMSCLKCMMFSNGSLVLSYIVNFGTMNPLDDS